MKKPLRDQIDELAAMGVAELEQQHLKLFGEEPTSAHRQFLLRKIAWRLRADREGGLPEPVRELARAIAKDVPLRNRVISNAGNRRAGFPIEQSAITTITPGHDSRLPMPGGLIVKKFKDRTIVVKVVDDGFEYDDRRYSSLSAIAQEITGTKWNGFLFFGRAQRKSAGNARIGSDRTGGRGRDLVGVSGDVSTGEVTKSRGGTDQWPTTKRRCPVLK